MLMSEESSIQSGAFESSSAADITFGQIETSFADRGVRLPQARHAVLARPDGARALGRAGFDVVSLAGNHVLDWGNDAFFETRANLDAAGVKVVGAGANIAEARRPVLFTLGDGTRVANVVPGAACALPAGRCAIVVKLQGDTDDFGAARRRKPGHN